MRSFKDKDWPTDRVDNTDQMQLQVLMDIRDQLKIVGKALSAQVRQQHALEWYVREEFRKQRLSAKKRVAK